MAHIFRHGSGWALLLCGCLSVSTPAMARADTMRIDSRHSYADFNVRLLWIKRMHGRFTRMGGTLTWSPQGTHGVVDAWIDVHSARMARPRYTRRLLAPEFFDAAAYPRIHFVSAPVALSNLAHGGPLRGRLTVRGVTRPVTFHMRPSHCPQPRTQACTIRVAGHIRRSRFGMPGHRALLSDRVQLGLVIVLTPVH